MKKILELSVSVLVLAGIVLPAGMQAKNDGRKPDVVSVMKQYRHEEGVDLINIGGMLLGMAKMSADTEEAGLLSGLERMVVMDAEESGEKTKDLIRKDMEKALEGYEKLIEVQDEDEALTIYCMMKDSETISEMVIFSNDPAIIYMKGAIPCEEVSKMVQD